ncbi:acetylornithine transaminase [Bacillus sp. SJS]|uniref:acetylornithine transaminase n=1 Tax=Bacillus sp. SJS TaxID=1423321 RepID=UPI0004DD431F|nr:acetylornithine transaminase [Bacillus sp. SJS]KZZ83740.1 acetylornithine aminotransferase [Bacillus sp. SJS]
MSSLFPTYARWNLTIEEGKGSWVKDKEGNKYLDFISGIAVCSLGHQFEPVKQAVAEQLDKVWHVSNLFRIELQEEAAGLLTKHSFADAVFFCNSGAEANEAAIKLARKHTGKGKIVTFKQSFHGRTFATMAATGQEKVRAGYGEMLPFFEYLPYNDLSALDELDGENCAAIMLEIIQGEGGVVPGTEAFLQKVEETCKTLGCLLIVDEVQTGIGRTGKLFAHEGLITPDIVTSAKGLGNGFPVGAMLGKSECTPSFQPGSHGSTFGGNPLAMAAVKAVLETVLEDGFLDAVQKNGENLMNHLKSELEILPMVNEVRGKGMMIGIEWNGPVAGIISELRENGLLVLPAGENVIRLLPPINSTDEECRMAVAMLKAVLDLHSKASV